MYRIRDFGIVAVTAVIGDLYPPPTGALNTPEMTSRVGWPMLRSQDILHSSSTSSYTFVTHHRFKRTNFASPATGPRYTPKLTKTRSDSHQSIFSPLPICLLKVLGLLSLHMLCGKLLTRYSASESLLVHYPRALLLKPVNDSSNISSRLANQVTISYPLYVSASGNPRRCCWHSRTCASLVRSE